MSEEYIRESLRDRSQIDPNREALLFGVKAAIGALPAGAVVSGFIDAFSAAFEMGTIPNPFVAATFTNPGEIDPTTAGIVWDHMADVVTPVLDPDHSSTYIASVKESDPNATEYEGDLIFAARSMEMANEEFRAWTDMADDVIDRSKFAKGDLAAKMIRAWSGREQSLAPADRALDVVTDDLDALDRMARLSTAPAFIKRREEQEEEAWELTKDHVAWRIGREKGYSPGGVPDYKVSVFDDLEGDLGLVSAAASDLAPATNALDDIWAHYRGQGQASSQTDEGLVPGAWSLEDSLAHTRDLTSHLRDAAANAPWASYREQDQVPALTDEGLVAGAWSLEDNLAHTRDWTSGLPDAAGAAGGELDDLGGQLTRTSNFALRMQDAVSAASYELWELESPLLRTRDGALDLADAMGSGYGGDGVTGAMDNAGLAADGLALSTGTAERALLAAGLTGDSTTQVLDLMRAAGLDPATSAWGELATAVHVWGDATDTEVGRVIGRLGELASVQGGGGPGSSGSGDSGGGSAQADLGRLMALAQRVAERRADMGDLNPQHIAHELGKLPGQLRGAGSLEEKLALLRLFFAGGAHGIAFGLGPSAGDLGVNIPQFAGGGTVPGPLGAPQLIVAHGGEHIVPHRATGSPTIIRIELDREVLSQAVLGDLLRLQGREVTLGLS